VVLVDHLRHVEAVVVQLQALVGRAFHDAVALGQRAYDDVAVVEGAEVDRVGVGEPEAQRARR
jgi:hypothetical protein